MVHLKHYFILSIFGFVASGFGGGMLFTFYFITLDSVMLIGSIVSMIGFGLIIFALTKLKGLWSFEVVEE